MPVVRGAGVPMEGAGGNRYAALARPSTGARELVLARAVKDVGAASVAHSHDREEVILVLAGEARAVLDGREERIGPGDALIVPAGVVHQVSNPGPEPFECVLAKPAGTRFFAPDGTAMATPGWMT